MLSQPTTSDNDGHNYNNYMQTGGFNDNESSQFDKDIELSRLTVSISAITDKGDALQNVDSTDLYEPKMQMEELNQNPLLNY